jgi:hypothetical protein
LLVHIGDPSSNQATTLESQVIHMIQELFGQTLRNLIFLDHANLQLNLKKQCMILNAPKNENVQ